MGTAGGRGQRRCGDAVWLAAFFPTLPMHLVSSPAAPLSLLPASASAASHLVAHQHHGDVLAHPDKVPVPVRHVLVGGTRGHVEHDDGAVGLDAAGGGQKRWQQQWHWRQRASLIPTAASPPFSSSLPHSLVAIAQAGILLLTSSVPHVEHLQREDGEAKEGPVSKGKKKHGGRSGSTRMALPHQGNARPRMHLQQKCALPHHAQSCPCWS